MHHITIQTLPPFALTDLAECAKLFDVAEVVG
jgi:hypothetical protein